LSLDERDKMLIAAIDDDHARERKGRTYTQSELDALIAQATAEALEAAVAIADAEFVSYHDAANKIRALIPKKES
jgi:hypothetical protein